MKTKHLVIGAIVLVGGYYLYTKLSAPSAPAAGVVPAPMTTLS